MHLSIELFSHYSGTAQWLQSYRDDRRCIDAYAKINLHTPVPTPLESPEAMLCQLQAGLPGVRAQQRTPSPLLHTIYSVISAVQSTQSMGQHIQ